MPESFHPPHRFQTDEHHVFKRPGFLCLRRQPATHLHRRARQTLGVAADVYSILSIGNVSQALIHLDGDETLISNEGSTAGGPPSLNPINESWPYSLFLGSLKPEAKRFKRWGDT